MVATASQTGWCLLKYRYFKYSSRTNCFLYAFYCVRQCSILIVNSLPAEDAEARTGEVTERRFGEIRRMLSDRVRAEASQRETENQEKDSRIHQLETTLEDQVQEIAELKEELKAMTRGQNQTVETHSERITLLSEDDETVEPQPAGERNRHRPKGNRRRIQKDAAQMAKSRSSPDTETDPSTMKLKEKIQFFEKLNEDNQATPVHGQELPAGKISCRRKLSFLLKRQPSRTSIKWPRWR